MIDDQPLMVRAVESLLKSEFPGASVTCADSAGEGTRLGCSQDYDMVLVGLNQEGLDGLQVLDSVLRSRPAARVVLHSALEADHHGIRAMRAGDAALVYKSASPETLVSTLREVAAGGTVVPPRLAAALLAPDPVVASLSSREVQVARSLVGGKRPVQIAKELALSVKTVSTYRTRLYSKLGVSNLPDLVRVWEGLDL